MMTPAERNRVIRRSVIISLLGIITVYVLYLTLEVLLTVYVSALLAMGLSPVVRRIERRRMIGKRRFPRWMAILSLYVGFLMAVAAVMALVLPPMIEQTRQLIQELPRYSAEFQQSLIKRGLIEREYAWSDLFRTTEVSGGALTGIVGALQSLMAIGGALLTVLLLPFYLLLESDELHQRLLRVVKPQNRTRVDRIIRAVIGKVAAWLGGQMLLALIIGSTATIAFWLTGVPYFAVLGLLAAVGELIPVIGPILACIPAILLGWTVSTNLAIFVLIYTLAQQIIENNFLVPRIMERQVGVSAVTIIVAMLIGTVLFGFVGAILAIPTAGIVQIFIEEHFKHQAEEHFREETEAREGAQ